MLTIIVAVAVFPQDGEVEELTDLEKRTMALDLRTATYFELVAWCERLELSTRGSRSELQRRLEEYYGVSEAKEESEEKEKEGTEIEIESADGSRYYDIDDPPETYLQLLGNVVLVMYDEENGSVHRISSDRIIYNQTINSITATGNLKYVLEQEENTETFTGESLTVNLDDWQGIFIRGTSKTERTVEEEELTFFYTGNTIYRLADDTIIMKQGIITSSEREEPYYHIDAERIWVLGPGEWALRNAVLYVGRVPLFYFPFFFYPGNELILHPSTGYRDIEGYYLQLTGYILGKREKSDESLSFLQVADDSGTSYKTEPWGIYLQKIRTEEGEEGEKSGEDTKDYIKFLFDIYSRLGLYAGIAGEVTPEEVFDSLSFDIGIARSRDLFPGPDGVYTYLSRNDEGEYESRWNDSYFLGINLPVRFGLDFETSIKLSSLNMSLAFPLYSDPWFRRDFADREERIDWASLLGIDEDGDTEDEGERSSSEGKIDRFSWQLSGRYNAQTAELRPYIQSLSLNRINAAINWKSKELQSEYLPDSIGPAEYRYPEREFYVPDSFLLPSISGRISGSLIPTATSGGKQERKERVSPDRDIELKPPWDDQEVQEEEKKEIEEELTIPSVQGDISIQAPPTMKETRHTLSYSLTPDFSIDSRYKNADWIQPQDIDFTTEYSVLSTRASGSLQYSSNFFGNLLNIRNNLGISGVYREHYGGSEETVANWESYIKQNKQASYARLTDAFSLTVSPLLGVDAFSKSSIQYGLTSILYQYKYDAEIEEYESRSLEWDKEIITAHTLGLNAVYSHFLGDQRLALSSVLPPREEVFTYKLSSTVGPVETTFGGGVRKDEDENDEESEPPVWTKDDFEWAEKFLFPQKSYVENKFVYSLEEEKASSNSSTVSLNGFDGKLTFSEAFTYDFLEEQPESTILSIKAWWLTLRFQASQSVPYTLIDDPNVPGRKNYEAGEKAFMPSQFSAAFDYDLAEERFWRNRIKVSASVDASWTLNLARATDSSMTFGLNLDGEIAEFLILSVSSKSTNKASYRYVPWLSNSLGLDWLNPVVDIARSFNIFNRQDRVRSFFNLDNISINAIHPMPDWELELSYSGSPELREEDGDSFYKWIGEGSVFVRWKPIPEIKRKVTVSEDEVSF